MWVLAVLQLSVWLFALMLAMMVVTLAVLCIAAVDLLLWFELGAPAVALHLSVVAALLLRRAARLSPEAIAA